jgi:hypothetical protein
MSFYFFFNVCKIHLIFLNLLICSYPCKNKYNIVHYTRVLGQYDHNLSVRVMDGTSQTRMARLP